VNEMLPAAGQGIVAIECLASNEFAKSAARAVNHAPSETAALVERGLLQKFGTRLDCYSVVAAHWSGGRLRAFYEGMRAEGSDVDSVYAQLVEARL
jgi:porphobilinogen deaminase